MDLRTKAQRRLLRVMEKRGGKGFRILRSAETGIQTYERCTTPGCFRLTVLRCGACPDCCWRHGR